MTTPAETTASVDEELVGIEAVRRALEGAWDTPVSTFAVGLFAVLADDPLPLRRATRTCTVSSAQVVSWAQRQAALRPHLRARANAIAPRGTRNHLIRLARELEAAKRPIAEEGLAEVLASEVETTRCVYFIRAGDGPIKIGTTQRLRGRLAEIQATAPVELRVLLYVPGGLHEERAIHERFRAARLHGEWFRATPELLQFIDAERRRQGTDDGA